MNEPVPWRRDAGAQRRTRTPTVPRNHRQHPDPRPDHFEQIDADCVEQEGVDREFDRLCVVLGAGVILSSEPRGQRPYVQRGTGRRSVKDHPRGLRGLPGAAFELSALIWQSRTQRMSPFPTVPRSCYRSSIFEVVRWTHTVRGWSQEHLRRRRIDDSPQRPDQGVPGHVDLASFSRPERGTADKHSLRLYRQYIQKRNMAARVDVAVGGVLVNRARA